MSRTILIFLISLIFITNSNAEVFSEVKMAADVIRAMDRPSTIMATLCWPLKKKLALHAEFAGENTSQIFMTQFLEEHSHGFSNENDNHIVFLVDLKCDFVGNYLSKSNDNRHFRLPFRWILLGFDDDKYGIISNISILIDSEVIVASETVNQSYLLRMIYKINLEDTIWHEDDYATWNSSHGLRLTPQRSLSLASKRADLGRLEISVCYVVTDNNSIAHLYDGIDDHIDTITKVNYPTTIHLFDFLNASPKFVFVNTWGYNVNGTWNGMTGYLVREEVDFGGSPMFFTSERLSIVDYIASPTPTRSKFVFQQPKLSYTSNLFLLSFRDAVWYSSLALVVIMFVALLVVTFWEWRLMRRKDEFDPPSSLLQANVGDVAMLVYGAVCQQGSTVELKGALGRIVMLILFLALMFLYTSYSANIVALLQSSSNQIKTLEDLLNSRLKFGVHDTVFNRYYFSDSRRYLKSCQDHVLENADFHETTGHTNLAREPETATEPTRKALYNTKIAPTGAPSRFMSMEEGVKNIRKGLFAFHMETGVGYKFVGKFFQEGEKCGLQEIQYLQVIDPWVAVRKNTPYKEMFKIGMKRIQEHGLQSRENLLFYKKRPKCTENGANFISVSMVDCYPAIMVLSYGVALAVIILLMEILVHRAKEKRTRQ